MEEDQMETMIMERLEGLEAGSAVNIVTDLTGYFSAVKSSLKYAKEKGLPVIYITSTIPSHILTEQLKSEETPVDHIQFVDCISFMVGSSHEATENTLYIESPTMLEAIMLKTTLWLKKLKKDEVLVLLDSVNSLSMHNDEVLVTEFLHYFINSMRSRDVITVVLSVAEQTPEDVETLLKLVCDESIDVASEEEM